jgi:DNA polymerase III subunit beta
MPDDQLAEDARQMSFAGKPDTGFTAKRFHLLQLTERAAAVVPGKNIYPLLSNFQVTIGDGRIRVAATDMELSVLSESTLVVCRGHGTVLIPARRFLSILRESAEGDIDVRISKGTACITAGQASWELSLQPADDYPPLPAGEDIQFTNVNRPRMLAAIELVKGAASRDGTNPRLMAVSVSGGRVIASSHVRLHRARIDNFPVDLQVPIGAVDDLLRLLGNCQAEEIGIGEDRYVLVFKIGDDLFMAGKLASEYPDQEKRLLSPHLASNQTLTVDKGELAAAIRRVRITADPETAAIGLKMTAGRLTVVSRDKNRNSAAEEIPAQWTSKERLVVVNHEHLVDLLGLATGPQVTLRIGADAGKRRSPLLLTDDKAGTAGVIGQLPPVLVE